MIIANINGIDYETDTPEQLAVLHAKMAENGIEAVLLLEIGVDEDGEDFRRATDEFHKAP